MTSAPTNEQTPPSAAGEDSAAVSKPEGPEQRVVCNQCGYRLDPADTARLAAVPCVVRAFLEESFHIWRCEGCRTLHCLEVVDLGHYYSKYPFANAELSWPMRLFYRNLLSRLKRHGFSHENSLLDFGCGNGLFVRYLQGRGFANCYGYDPYSEPESCGDPAVLEKAPFDFVQIQDVLEHVEDPSTLLSEMDTYLAPGGYILVGTPNADRLDISCPRKFSNELHVPYHLHIYTRETVEAFGRRQGWEPVGFFDRSYHDLPYLGMNCRATKHYQNLMGGSMDALFDPIRPAVAVSSPRFMFFTLFGYWLSHRSDMTIVFRKHA